MKLPYDGIAQIVVRRVIMERDGITKGLISVLSRVEPCQSHTIRRDRHARQWRLVSSLYLWGTFLLSNPAPENGCSWVSWW